VTYEIAIEPVLFLWHLGKELLRIGIKSLFAARGAEVIFLSFVLGGYLALGLINLHLADRVNRHCHTCPLYFYVGGLNLLSLSEFVTTETELKAIAAAAMIGFKKP